MKKIITVVLLLCSFQLISQSCFTYDAAGNRTKREACIVSSSTSGHQEFEVLFESELEERSIAFENDLEEFIIYPNPSSGIFNLADQSKWIGSQISVHAQDGSLVYNSKITFEAIDLLFLNNGIYYLSVRRDNKIKTAKLFITK